ncbi:hypothetical protein PHLGIDRAFT_221070 [Phlebiopsis gigantea 11061_1 CR5-6]|uniref:BHLH domain-containing protein n=1 Tax=Phlebiopsis gigantea (strain 11061_1 CR5-6) TaxID=745531 RepID=A0A0C3SEL3_PHLG1|nr:hypothetical protein PHLGIDRAFT_221070 [Phlebiopsis gigantea 11061_1 CR5-6]
MNVDTQEPVAKTTEYQSRRPSLAGTKRKMSGDGPSGAADIDPQLIGPGMPSGMDAEGPAPKRRSSAFDTQRLAQLNLYDRRSSLDARGGAPGGGGGAQGPWWGSERREASTPFANTPVTAGGYTTTPSSAFSGDSPHGRPPPGIATFAWPTANPADPHQPQQQPPLPAQQADGHQMAQNIPSPYDPSLAMLPPGAFQQDRRMSVPNIAPENMPASPTNSPARALRSRSRPSSRARANQSAGTSTEQSPGPSNSSPEDAPGQAHSNKEAGSTPYSRSPELRVSHKLAERKRRKEMKDLFDELRDQLPADRGMKASKWEILSKAIDFIANLKQSHQDMSRDIDVLRHEVEGYRAGIPPPFVTGGPPPHVVYGHGPPPVGVQYAPGPPPGPGGPPQHVQPPPHAVQPLSRPGSSQNAYPPGAVPAHPPPNGTANPSTENPS